MKPIKMNGDLKDLLLVAEVIKGHFEKDDNLYLSKTMQNYNVYTVDINARKFQVRIYETPKTIIIRFYELGLKP